MGSLEGAQQLTGGGGVVAEISFVSGSRRPDSVGGGGGGSGNFPWFPEAGPVLTTFADLPRYSH